MKKSGKKCSIRIWFFLRFPQITKLTHNPLTAPPYPRHLTKIETWIIEGLKVLLGEFYDGFYYASFSVLLLWLCSIPLVTSIRQIVKGNSCWWRWYLLGVFLFRLWQSRRTLLSCFPSDYGGIRRFAAFRVVDSVLLFYFVYVGYREYGLLWEIVSFRKGWLLIIRANLRIFDELDCFVMEWRYVSLINF